MSSPPPTSVKNLLLFRRDFSRYTSVELERAEQALLTRFRDRWPEVRMLDLGVGTGRTTYTFAPLVGTYEGIDYTPEMFEGAKERMPEADQVRFQVGDARGLDELFDERFDLVLFSSNGIDAVTHEERLHILRQVRSLLREEGLFCFSSHSAHSLPLEKPGWTLDPRNPLRSAYRSGRSAQERRRVRRVNAGVDVPALHARGWGLVADGSHGFEERLYYVTAEEQVRQLQATGFGAIEILRNDGAAVDPADPGRDPWLHYLCEAG